MSSVLVILRSPVLDDYTVVGFDSQGLLSKVVHVRRRLLARHAVARKNADLRGTLPCVSAELVGSSSFVVNLLNFVRNQIKSKQRCWLNKKKDDPL